MIKKTYEDIVSLLEANSNKKVSTIMPQLLELVTAKTRAKSSHKDDQGNVIAIYCYYHKKWESITEVEYGRKSSTSTGLNTMCKTGVSRWTKQQREAKQLKEKLLSEIAVDPTRTDTLCEDLECIEADRARIVEDEEPGFDSLEELLSFNQ